MTQGLSFLRPQRTTSTTGLDERYHSHAKPTTLSGRVIPQKMEMDLYKSRSFSSLPSSSSISSKTAMVTASLKSPAVYPAILSLVGRMLRERVDAGSRLKNGLEYRDAFTGTEAVDTICRIVRTSDRNLALLLGRALDAQRVLHDVTYDHRLRDSPMEVYQFNEEEANGVFTLLTECYSPTCTRENLCYSIACPRRLEQQARLQRLDRSASRTSFSEKPEERALWTYSVPRELVDSVSKTELKRQEAIFETIYTERDFVKDLEYVRDFWIRPLRESSIVAEKERDRFIRTVFGGVLEILSVNKKFAEALSKRQREKPCVDQIGDIFLEYIPQFEYFTKYGAGRIFGKHEFERQKQNNALFARFVDETERLRESRKLDLSSFLSKPTSRPARYPLLLKTIMEHTEESNPDRGNLQQAIQLLSQMLDRINKETGIASDRYQLISLRQRLVFRPGEFVNLDLTSERRKLLLHTVARKSDKGEVQVYVIDHAVIFVKIKIVNRKEQYRVYNRPIPVGLLTVKLPLENRQKELLHVDGISLNGPFVKARLSDPRITFTHMGRKGYDLTLFFTPPQQKLLMESLNTQRQLIATNCDIFKLTALTRRFFDFANRLNCVVPFDGGKRLLYGTDSGVYMSNVTRTPNKSRTVSSPVKVISRINVMQLEVLQEFQTLLVLADKKLCVWPLEILYSAPDASRNGKLGRDLMSHVSFFRVGVCAGRMLVCAAKNGSAHLIKVFEPIDPIQQKKLNKKKFKSETKDVVFSSEPVSISFLKTRLCVGCTKGFEIVSVEDNAMESLLDPADTSLDFVIGKEGLKPLEIDRINSDFLLSYSDFSFFVNRNGWRSRNNWIIHWEGLPQAFAIWYPYLLAFEPGFIEIRHVETSELLRVIVAENIRLLHSSSQEILYAYEEGGYDVVASLDFWDKSRKE